MRISLKIVIVSILLSGCVGAGPITTATYTAKVASGIARVCPAPKEIGELLNCDARKVPSLTSDQVIAMWGNPKTRGVINGQEYLTYDRNLAWRGLLVFVVIPVPLLVPVGHNETTLYFENKQLVQTTYEEWKADIALCGLHSEGPDGFGCMAHWH